MKKMIVLFSCLVLLQIISLPQAQASTTDDTWLQNRFTANPLGLLLGIGSFDYERALSEKFSLTISPSFIYFGWGEDDLYGGGVGLGGNYFITGRAPKGLRVTADATPTYIATDSDTNSLLFCSRAMIGYNWIWDSQFTLGLAGGIQYIYITSSGVDSALKGLLPALSLNLGFAF